MKKLGFFLFFMVAYNLGANADISKIKIKGTPFQGSKIYMPTDGKSHPGVIMLHGSEGGSMPYYQIEAEFLASHGYVVLAFCWYNCGKNPFTSPYSSLENIELRMTIDAIKWFKNSKEVNGSKMALAGWSRGAEQAILLGTVKDAIDMIDLIAVHTPSDTVVNGFNWSTIDQRCWICTSFDLSCFNNSKDPNQWNWVNIRWNLSCGEYPKFFKDMNAWVLDGVPLKVDGVIEIEKFGKPVFVTVGDKDELWDFHKSERVAERLRKFGKPVELHVFPNEYHVFSSDNENRRHELLLKFLNQMSFNSH